MPRINIDLTGLTAARQQLQALTAEQRRLDLDVAAARSALAEARRTGAEDGAVGSLEQRLAAAETRRAASLAAQRAARSRIDGLAGGLIQQRDPSVMVQTLDGRFPIALLPVRIETRYVPVAPAQPTSLRIRVYPDDLHTIEHVPGLTADEQRAGAEYWTARFAHRDDDAASILRDLATLVGRGRAALVVRVLTPSNPLPAADEEAAPDLPTTETIDARAKATRAVLLPDRWCAIAYAAGRREIFRIWGNRIPDELLLSPDWLATDDPEALLGGERAWLVDFDKAVDNGMALEITQAALNAEAQRQGTVPFRLATGVIERLVVVGLEWTKNAEESAQELADLLAAHRDSTGLAFIPLGTPTNNTEAGASGYSPAEERTPPPPADDNEKDALQLLTWAFGIAPDALPADNIGHAHLAEQRTAMHMMNVLWRGTFGDYLLELWNPPLDESKRFLKTPALYATRSYAMAYVRATGALPLLRAGTQPYGILPVVGRRFTSTGSSVEATIGKLIGVLRPLWELARRSVPTMTDGSVEKAKDILQTAAWSQTAFYRDKEADKAMCRMPSPFADAQATSRDGLIKALLGAVGITNYALAHIYSCSDFRPDPPYSAGYLAGVPWVMADAKNPKIEAADETPLSAGDNYLAKIAAASIQSPNTARSYLFASQSGPSLLQALASYSVQKEQGDAVERFVLPSAAIQQVASLATTKMPYIEALAETASTFTVQTPKELANVSIRAVSGAATLGDHLASSLSVPFTAQAAPAHLAAERLVASVGHLVEPTRNLGAVKLSLDYLSGRTVGELNVAFRSTLDCFSYRLDAWISARANRRLEQMRASAAEGIYTGGFAWVENLKADTRPDSEGYLLAPSLGQAATAAILRSGFMANHESGAFDVALDSKRTSRAVAILQGLTRDQPLAALYGYRIERGLRDGLLGRFIWPFRLAFPWRPAGAAPTDESKEAIGARDVVDGVALIDAWEANPNDVRARLTTALAHLEQAGAPPTNDEWGRVSAVIADAVDLADSVSDLLMAEGTHQIVQGNLDRAAAVMAVADKQSLPIETEFNQTVRGGAGYTQRLIAMCPDAAGGWPADRRSQVEPGVDAWLAVMLGEPSIYRFAARVQRGTNAEGQPILDAEPAVVSLADLGLSALSAVLLATGVSGRKVADASDTGFRKHLVAAFTQTLVEPETITGLEIQQEGDTPDALGLGHFEALAMTLKAVVDKSRPATRKDVARITDAVEDAAGVDEGEFPGVDLADIEARAGLAVDALDAIMAGLAAVADAASLFQELAAAEAYLPSSRWPAQVFAVEAAGLAPAERDARALDARDALLAQLEAVKTDVAEPPPLLDGQTTPTHGQRVQRAIDRIKRLLGKDFPVVPRCSLGGYAAEFNASLAEQGALNAGDAWAVHGWLAQLACVREGVNRFAAGLSAHEALVAPGFAADFSLVQFPHVPDQVWAARPEAWVEPEGASFDPKDVPEELHDYLSQHAGAAFKDIHRVAPDLAIAFHAPGGLGAIADGQTFAALVCDEWPEFIPDRYQTSAITFHYDAPGARPPQSVLLALPPTLGQDAWTFDDLMDVIHEAFDLAKLRGVRPRDLAGGLGALLPGNYLPQSYTDDLPSVQVLKMQRDAMGKLATTALEPSANVFTLGKV